MEMRYGENSIILVFVMKYAGYCENLAHAKSRLFSPCPSRQLGARLNLFKMLKLWTAFL